VFREVEPIPVRRERRRAAQAPEVTAAEIANATGENPAAGKEVS
jgi:hypothetical protein